MIPTLVVPAIEPASASAKENVEKSESLDTENNSSLFDT